MTLSSPGMCLLVVSLAALAVALPMADASAAAQQPSNEAPVVISRGREVALTAHLAPEQPTVFLFMKPSSSLEREFMESIRREAKARFALRLIYLQTGQEPVARQHQVAETPTALVYDRRGRLVSRSPKAADIQEGARKAASVMRIDWAEEGTPLFAEAEKTLHGRKLTAGILRTMSLKPEYLAHINDLSLKAHFSDGFLDRRTKEMIATYVSALNRCKY